MYLFRIRCPSLTYVIDRNLVQSILVMIWLAKNVFFFKSYFCYNEVRGEIVGYHGSLLNSPDVICTSSKTSQIFEVKMNHT